MVNYQIILFQIKKTPRMFCKRLQFTIFVTDFNER